MTDDLFTGVAARTATFSDCRRYRYELQIKWDASRESLIVIMLNPSTADEVKNDPTVERMERRARKMGFGGLMVLNLFAFRATDPEEMKVCLLPIGDMNDRFIRQALRCVPDNSFIMVGWGAHGGHHGRSHTVAKMIADAGVEARCLGVTKDGQPLHPLYQPYEAELVTWTPPA